ncbi:late embryogenesis abundant protein Lea5-like [Zingiber officinale]|uniref:Uncharacterized protein n=1 Tax=Zingiber officinale TaxID=94328 RepID=A0A8J5BUB2_ZINOF|nr:late embryogenesis abundant protein Lea5-like [Zingiber officinale]KAG6467166.1 hypothetical protein ZIOFF_075034 [Zingiber officinale]
MLSSAINYTTSLSVIRHRTKRRKGGAHEQEEEEREQMAARSFVGVAASLKNNITTRFASRMGYAATATAATVEICGEKTAAVGQVVLNSTTAAADASYLSASTSSWMPDPVTGYYRPGNRRKEAETVELRETCRSHEQSN